MSANQMSLFFPHVPRETQAEDAQCEVVSAPPWNVRKDGLWSVIHPTSKLKDAVRNDAERTMAMVQKLSTMAPPVRKKLARDGTLVRLKRLATVLAMYAGISCPNYNARGKKQRAM